MAPYEVWWRNPALHTQRLIEVSDEEAAKALVEHYTKKYQHFYGFQAPEYREKPEAT